MFLRLQVSGYKKSATRPLWGENLTHMNSVVIDLLCTCKNSWFAMPIKNFITLRIAVVAVTMITNHEFREAVSNKIDLAQTPESKFTQLSLLQD